MSKNIDVDVYSFLVKNLKDLSLSETQINILEKEVGKRGVKRTLNSYKKKKEEKLKQENPNDFSLKFFEEVVKTLEKLEKKI